MDRRSGAGQAEGDRDLSPGADRMGTVGRGHEAPFTNGFHGSLVESRKATAGGDGDVLRTTLLVDQHFQAHRAFLTRASRGGRIGRIDSIAGLEVLRNRASRADIDRTERGTRDVYYRSEEVRRSGDEDSPSS